MSWNTFKKKQDSLYYSTFNLNPQKLHELKGPQDTISDMSWFNQYVICSSWDKSVYLWETKKNGKNIQSRPLKKFTQDSPVFSCKFINNSIVSGTGSGCIVKNDLQNPNPFIVGKHNNLPVSGLEFIQPYNLILSSSWDKRCCYWDLRQNKCTLSIPMPELVYRISVMNEMLTVLCKGKYQDQKTYNQPVFIFDLRKPKSPVKFESPGLCLLSRCISISPTKKFYAVGDIGGRVAIQSLSGGIKPFKFKCAVEGHKRFPVNDICFNPKNGLMGTVSGDGRYNIWNVEKQNREEKPSKRISSSLTRCSFNQQGDIFAIAVSYDFTRGTNDKLYKNKTHQRILLYSCN